MNAPLTQSARTLMAAAASRAVRPRERLTVSQWADNHRKLSSEGSNEVGRWRTSRNPLLREIMDNLSAQSTVRETTCMKPGQFGVTEGPFISTIGYYMEHHPSPVLVFMPTIVNRDKWKIQKLDPALENTDCLREKLGTQKSRDASHTKDVIRGPGFIVFLAGGNSTSSYDQVSAKIALVDDYDRFPAEVGNEGDPGELIDGRLSAFPNSYKRLNASTPTIDAASHIQKKYDEGDRRKYHVPCPHCGELQPLKWENLKANLELTKAYYVCEHNGCVIEEYHKASMLAEVGHGGNARWVPEKPEEKKHRSYQWSKLYCSDGLGPTWLDLLIRFKRIHKDTAKLKTFINTALGECWKDRTADKLKTNELEKRAGEHSAGIIPPGCLALTMGVDTQDNWLAYKLLGWGADGRHWIIKFGEIQGKTTGTQVWDELEAEIHLTLVNSFGREMRIRAVGIDSRGHRAEEVKNFVMRPSLKVPVYAVQGSTTRMGRAIAQSGSYPNKSKTGKVIKHGYCTWNVGTEHCKDYLYGNLVDDSDRTPDARVINFPQGLETEYYDGLISEVYDPEKKRYIPRVGAKYKRNEPLDTFVYAWAIGQHRDINLGRGRTGRPDPKYWERLEVMLEGENKVEVYAPREDAAPATAQAPQPAGTSISSGRISLGKNGRFGR